MDAENEQLLPYVMPEEVSRQLVNLPLAIAPFCCDLVEKLSNSALDFKTRMKIVDKALIRFVSDLTYEHYYNSIIDFLLWTQTLDTVLQHKNIDRNHIIWVVKRVLQIFDNDIMTKRDAKQLEKLFSEQVDSRKECFISLFHAVFLTKARAEFVANLCTQLAFERFVNFLFTKLETDTQQVFLWIKTMELYNYVENFPIEDVVDSAVLREKTGLLCEMCTADESKVLAKSVVEYLNNFSASLFQRYDPEYTACRPTAKYNQLKQRDREILRLAFDYRKRFDLDISTVNNCTFVRMMRAFINAFKTNKKAEEREKEGFYQKVSHIMTVGGKRTQHAILSYLADWQAKGEAVMMALKMDIKKKDWPPKMKNLGSDFVGKIKEQFDIRNEVILKEQDEIKNGFNLLSDKAGDHTVNLIDSDDAICNLLTPFIQNPKNRFFGIDVEWDMSYSGEIGTVSLIQMSGANQTMLIDIHSLRTVHKWSDKKFLNKLFKLIFKHDKRVYGFALESDMKTIAFNFPLFKTNLLPRLNNLVCLHVAVTTIHGDFDLCKAIFGENPPDELNLSSLARHFLKFALDKNEQMSVWSCRPLRKAQQFYAAKDSYTVVQLTNTLTKALNKTYPNKMDLVFAPWKMDQRLFADADNLDLPLHSTKNKTKSKHITKEELNNIIKLVNDKLDCARFTKVDDLLFVVDSMCTPLGHCLRRMGISAILCADEPDVLKAAYGQSNSMVLTTGRACKKYPFGDRVKNVKITLSLDEQLYDILLREQIRVDPDNIRPKCAKCNGDEMIYVPELCISYIRFQMAYEKPTHAVDIDVNNLLELQDELERLDPRADSIHPCHFRRIDKDLHAILPNAIINLEKLYIQRTEDSVIVDPEKKTDLHPSTHLLSTDYDKNQLYAICFECGSENVECTIAL